MYYKYQCPLLILVSRLWLYLSLQTLHLVSGGKYPKLLFFGFTSSTTIIFCIAHSFATSSFQSQKHIKPAWSRLLTCTPWSKPPRPLPPLPETQAAETQMEDYLRSCSKRSHVLACWSRTWLQREPQARTTWLEWPSRCRPISITRSKCNYRNNCNSYMKTMLKLTLRR